MSFEKLMRSKHIYVGKKKALILKDLGEWAWNKILKDIKAVKMPLQAKKECWDFDYENLEDYYTVENEGSELSLCWKIAVACLSKREIKKRLKELKKE